MAAGWRRGREEAGGPPGCPAAAFVQLLPWRARPDAGVGPRPGQTAGSVALGRGARRALGQGRGGPFPHRCGARGGGTGPDSPGQRTVPSRPEEAVEFEPTTRCQQPCPRSAERRACFCLGLGAGLGVGMKGPCSEPGALRPLSPVVPVPSLCECESKGRVTSVLGYRWLRNGCDTRLQVPQRKSEYGTLVVGWCDS